MSDIKERLDAARRHWNAMRAETIPTVSDEDNLDALICEGLNHIAALEAEVEKWRTSADHQRELLQQLNAMFGGPEVGSFDQFVEKMRVGKRYATDAHDDLRIAAENYVLAIEDENSTPRDRAQTLQVLKGAVAVLHTSEALKDQEA